MAFSVCVLSGIAVVGICVARLKTRRGEKRNVQTIFTTAK